MSVSLTGDDISLVAGRVLEDLSDGDCVNIDVPNDIASGKRGKNGNVIIAYNSTGEVVEVTYRILLGSADDKFFNGQYISYKNSRAGYILLTGEFVKNVGDGFGNITKVIYTMTSGFIKKMPSIKENQEGDTEQAVVVYVVQYNNTDRSVS
jgi:hypothetical protein